MADRFRTATGIAIGLLLLLIVAFAAVRSMESHEHHGSEETHQHTHP